MALSNLDLWNELRKSNPNFANITSEATKETFTQAGFEKLKNFHIEALNSFMELSLRAVLQQVNIAHAKDPLDGFGEYYDAGFGGYIQRIAGPHVKAINPQFRDIKDGSTYSPFVVKKEVPTERFFKKNFDFTATITVQQEAIWRDAFISPYGMSELAAAYMEALRNAFVMERYAAKLEAINAGLNSTDNKLQDSQIIDAGFKLEEGKDFNSLSADQLASFIAAVRNTVEAMQISAQTGSFNALHWASTQDIGRLVLLVRPGISAALATKLLANAFNVDQLNLPVTVKTVENFGGITYYTDDALSTPAYPVYDDLGAIKGWADSSETAEAGTVNKDLADLYAKDPNADVVAVLADKGWVFESEQMGFRIESIYNPRILADHYWAHYIGSINVDSLYNVVVFKQTSEAV